MSKKTRLVAWRSDY